MQYLVKCRICNEDYHYGHECKSDNKKSIAAYFRIAVRLIRKYIVDLFLKDYLEDFILREHRVYGDQARLFISKTANVNNALFNTASGNITIEDNVIFGHGVMVLTGHHDYAEIGRSRKESIPASGREITIQHGAWISSGSIIIGPCVIGRHAVVAAGAVVTKDVPPCSVYAGPAASLKKMIDFGAE